MSNHITNAAGQWAVIWDFDGTLADSMPLHFEVWQSFMRQNQLEFNRAEFLATAGKPAASILQNYFPTSSATEIDRLAFEKDALFRELSITHGVQLFDGAARLLAGLAQAGFKQAVGSGSPPENLRLAYEQHPVLKKYIEVTVAAGDTPNSKPHPEVFLTAAERLGVAPAHCLVVEDGVLGVEAAHRAGMHCVAIVGEQDAAAFLAVGATKIVTNLAELDVISIQKLLGLAV